MLPLLVSLSEAAYPDKYGGLPNGAKGSLDYCYATKKGNCISITGNTNMASEGTRVYFRIYDEKNIPMEWTMLKHSTTSWSGNGWKITYGVERNAYKDVLQSFYEITNNAGRDFYFDLAFYTPINFGENGTHARLFIDGNGDAIGIDGGDKKMYFQVKKTPWSMHNELYDYLGSVDSIYIGPTKEEKDLPVLDNTYDNEYYSSGNVNSAMGFAWKKHLLKKGDAHRFGFKVQVTNDFIRLPLIKDITPLKESYPDPFMVILNVTGYGNTPVEARLGFTPSYSKLCGTFTPKSDMETVTVNCTLSFGDKNVSNYKPIAIQNGNKGWEARFWQRHLKEGTMRPKLKLKTWPKGSYSASDAYIFIDGEVDDEHYVNINYQFDKRDEVVGDRFITSQEFETLPFTYNIPFPTDLGFGDNHTIKIWVTDDNGLWSDPIEQIFTYGAAEKPIVRNIYISEERLLHNSGETRLVIYGEGIYTKANKIAKVYVRVDNEQSEHLLTTFEAKNEPVPIAGFYNFTAKDASHHTFTVYARDSDDSTQSQPESPVTTPLIVWDPKSAQAFGNIGKFVDKTLQIDKSVTTLFNLEYQDVNQRPRKISAFDEGFYCKFKTYSGIDTTSLLGEYDFIHTSQGKINKNDFDIQFKISEDPNTKFTVAKFTVKNNQFFERIFDLGIVVNSDLAGNQKSITHDSAENKIVVESNEEFVSYTLFYSQSDPKAAVTGVYLGKIERKDKTWNKKPFFSKDKSSQNLNAYGLTWSAQKIPGEGSVEFTLTFAAYGKVKSPTRLIDRKNWKQHYKKTDTETLDIEVIDADNDEELLISVNENNNINNYSLKIDQSQHRFTPVLNFSQVGEATTYSVTVQAFDKNPQTRFPSNIINKIVYLKEPPSIKVDDLPKRYYSTRDKLETTVSISGTSAQKVDIYYRLLLPSQSGMAESAERLAKRGVLANGEKETISIPLDKDVFPLEDAIWKIKLYAKDDKLMSEVKELEFNLNPYDPPKLFRAGISKKSAHVGERILGYVVVNDNQNDFLEIYVSFDKINFPSIPTHTINKNVNAGRDTPYAFYWNVPATETGVKDVYIMVKDSEGASSAVVGPNTLVITG